HHHEDAVHHHEVAHVHADGTAHRHEVVVDDDDDDDAALGEHIKEPGCPCCWNVAIVTGVLPEPVAPAALITASSKLAIEPPAACHGLRKDRKSTRLNSS